MSVLFPPAVFESFDGESVSSYSTKGKSEADSYNIYAFIELQGVFSDKSMKITCTCASVRWCALRIMESSCVLISVARLSLFVPIHLKQSMGNYFSPVKGNYSSLT